MSLSERIDAPPQAGVHGLPCSVGRLRAELPTDEQAALDRMLFDLNWSARQVHEAVADEGHSVAWQQIGIHRRGQCRCGKASA